MTDNLVLITSVINTPNNNPWSYSSTRSVFNREERFDQTKKTIKSIKELIPNYKIIIVDCTDYTEEEKSFFLEECDYVLNLWERSDLHNNFFGKSKALGEGTMTIEAIKYLQDKKIEFKNFFKISGRYWLSERFNYNKFNNNKLICHKINNDIGNIDTWLYKMPYSYINIWKEFLLKNIDLMINCIGYETLFGHFLKYINYDEVIFYEIMGCKGINAAGSIIDK
tara:strand:- start:990 stop:1661 length:672 start_codon:yes stop_codon:yes gene_type:complete